MKKSKESDYSEYNFGFNNQLNLIDLHVSFSLVVPSLGLLTILMKSFFLALIVF